MESTERDARSSSVPAMRPPGSPRCGVPGRLEYRRAAGERPPRARPQRRGSPGPNPNPAVKPAFAESTAAPGCGRAGRRARGGRFSFGRAPHAPKARRGNRPLAGLFAFRGALDLTAFREERWRDCSEVFPCEPLRVFVRRGRLRPSGLRRAYPLHAPGAPGNGPQGEGEGLRGGLRTLPRLSGRPSPCGSPCVRRFARGAGGSAARSLVRALSCYRGGFTAYVQPRLVR